MSGVPPETPVVHPLLFESAVPPSPKQTEEGDQAGEQ